jgi:hypothetical protein
VKKSKEVKWLDEPAEKDYPAAEAYLQLLFNDKSVRKLMRNLRCANVTKFAAKDILRASGLPMAEIQAFDWKLQHTEVENGDPLSPLLLVRSGSGKHLIIADGFHRLCAVFAFDQKAMVLCKIA